MPATTGARELSGWEAPARSRRRWPAALLAAALLAAAAAVPTLGRDDPGLTVEADPEPPRPPPAEPEPDPWVRQEGAVGTWVSLPEAPLSPRVDPIAVWTGRGEGYAPRARGEVLVWGGHRDREGLADGAAYDPFRGEWRRIAEAPHAWRRGSTVAATWTGTELFTLVSPRGPHPASAALYDPDADRWRQAAIPPAHLVFWQAVGWTGAEVVVLAFARDLSTHRAAAYDPASDRWRRVPPARVLDDQGRLLAASLPAGLAVFGEAQGRPAVTLLRPGADDWTQPDVLPAPASTVPRPLLGATTVDHAAGRLLLVGVTARDQGTRRAWAWAPEDGWEPLPALRTDSPSRMRLAWGGGRLLAWLGEGTAPGAVLDTHEGTWRPMAPPPLSPRQGAGVTWTGRVLVVWGGAHDGETLADGAAYLPWSRGLSDGRVRLTPRR